MSDDEKKPVVPPEGNPDGKNLTRQTDKSDSPAPPPRSPIIRRPAAQAPDTAGADRDGRDRDNTEAPGNAGEQSSSRTIHIQMPEETEPDTAATQASPGAGREGDSSQTAHIKMEDDTAATLAGPTAAVPGSKPPNIPPTIRLKAPAKAGMTMSPNLGQPRPDSSGEGGKRSTSRIPLPSVTPPPGVPRPGSQPLADGPKPMDPAQVQAAKGKTSRISLNEALAGSGDFTKKDAPKTIRLKRPSPPPAGPAPDTSAPTVVARKKTSKIPEAEEDQGTPTRRKTIKLKRPSPPPSVGVQIKQEEGEGAKTLPRTEVPAAQAQATERVHVLFPICGLAAVLLTAALIWVLALHAVGPDKSLTNLSSWRDGPDLSFPGLLSID